MTLFIAQSPEESEKSKRLDILFSSIPVADSLRPVPGNGSLSPKVTLVFINPTYRNISTSPQWNGARFPFVGTKQLWKVLFNAGWLPDELWKSINKGWSEELSFSALEWMVENKIWLTNLVKTAYSHSRIPGKEMLVEGKALLEKELSILKPWFIISMGLVPFKLMAGLSVKLSDIYDMAMEGKIKEWKFSSSRLLLSYFPVGRGNPKRAADMLRIYANAFEFFQKS